MSLIIWKRGARLNEGPSYPLMGFMENSSLPLVYKKRLMKTIIVPTGHRLEWGGGDREKGKKKEKREREGGREREERINWLMFL